LGAKSAKEIKKGANRQCVSVNPIPAFRSNLFGFPSCVSSRVIQKGFSLHTSEATAKGIEAKIGMVVSFGQLSTKNILPQKSLNQRLALNLQKMI
jgi:hypothetical protein